MLRHSLLVPGRLVAGLLLATALLLPGQPALAEAVLRFAWLSDTHIGSEGGADDLRASVRDINSIAGLRFVVISGDITEYGSLKQFRLTQEILHNLKVRYYLIPGNHDTKWSESGATDFSRLWKADRFVFDRGGYRFIGLHQGPLMKMADGHWAPQDVRWLKQTLEQTGKERPIIFATHYPIDEGIANWFVVLDLLKQYNTQAVLCGHGHANQKYLFEGVPGVMGRSNKSGPRRPSGFNLVEIANGEMTFVERAGGQSSSAPWHTVKLTKHHYLATQAGGTNEFPRPGFSVNREYGNVRPRWSFETGYTIASTPAVWKDLAIVGDASGAVYGLDLKSGHVRWKFNAGNAVYSTPVISGNCAIFGSADGKVYCLDASSGRRLWSYKTKRPIVASPAVSGDTVYVGSSEGKFRALAVRSGKLRWEFDGVRGFVETRPLVYEGKVIFGAWDEHLYALNADDGRLVWKWKGDKQGTLYSPAACWPVAGDGKVFVVAPDRQMTAIDARTGEQVWRTGKYAVRESIGISANGSRFYVRTMNDFLYAFSTTGSRPQKVWELNAGFGYDINSGMLVEKEGTVFYGTKNGLLLAVDGATGKLEWKHKLGTGVVNTVMPMDGKRVLTTDFDGRVALIE